MRRLSPLPSLAALARRAAAPAEPAFFAGDAIDGPSADIRALGDLDLARDGTGALAYVKRVDGVDRVFVSRFERGAFQPPERVDAALPGPSSQPVVGASDSGRLGDRLRQRGHGLRRRAAAAGAGLRGRRSPLGAGLRPVRRPVDQRHGVRVVHLRPATCASRAWTAATNAWTGLPQPADVDPAPRGGRRRRAARRVAISADGIGVVTWGEGGHVFARKMFDSGLSNAPQDLTPPDFGGRVATVSDLPDVDAEDDSSYAWVVFRQTFADGGSRTLARRQRGTAFDPPVAVDTGDEPSTGPRIDLNGRGAGARDVGGREHRPAARRRSSTSATLFRPGGRILAPSVAGGRRRAGDLGEQPTVVGGRARRRRRPPPCGLRAPVRRRRRPAQDEHAVAPGARAGRPGRAASTPRRTAPAASSSRGSRAAPGERRIVAGYFDRPPSRFLGYTGQGCCRGVTPTLTLAGVVQHLGPDALRRARRRHARRPRRSDTQLELAAPLAARHAPLAGPRDRHPRAGDALEDARCCASTAARRC